jgi:hypothetical protein
MVYFKFNKFRPREIMKIKNKREKPPRVRKRNSMVLEVIDIKRIEA